MLILQSAGVAKKIVNLLEELYNKAESAVFVNGHFSSHFQIRNGVRQDCTATPKLFNCLMDHFLNKTLLAHPFSIDFAGRVLSDIDFADDIALVCENLTDIQTALETLASAAEKLSLNVHWTKTKIFPVDKTPCSPLTAIEVFGQDVEIVKRFNYLGSIVFSNGNSDAEISLRVAKANAVFSRLLRSIFHKPQISCLTKARICSASVAGAALYSSETWPLTQSQLMKMDAVQTKHLAKSSRLGGSTGYETRMSCVPLNYYPCPNSSSPAHCVGTVIYFAYPLKHLPDLYSTSIQLQTVEKTPGVDHVQDGRISSTIDSQRWALTPAKLLPSPETGHFGDD